jgi:hypothetical protein
MHNVEPHSSHGKGKQSCEYDTLPQVRSQEHEHDVREKEAGEKDGRFRVYLPVIAPLPSGPLKVGVHALAQCSMELEVVVEFQPWDGLPGPNRISGFRSAFQLLPHRAPLES